LLESSEPFDELGDLALGPLIGTALLALEDLRPEIAEQRLRLPVGVRAVEPLHRLLGLGGELLRLVHESHRGSFVLPGSAPGPSRLQGRGRTCNVVIMSDTSPVSTTVDGDVAVITLDDGKANAISFEVLDGLNAALDAAFSSAKAIALIGREGKFSAGFNLKIMTGDIADARRLLGGGAELGIKILEAPIPLVLGVTGHALAMGGILTTTADYRVGAAGDYKLGLNEVAIGMPVPKFAVELTRDRLAKKWFTRCVQHAELCSPEQAVDAGFLDEVVPLADVRDRAVAVAQRLADTVHPKPFRVTRTTIRGALAADLRESLAEDLALFDVATPS